MGSDLAIWYCAPMRHCRTQHLTTCPSVSRRRVGYHHLPSHLRSPSSRRATAHLSAGRAHPRRRSCHHPTPPYCRTQRSVQAEMQQRVLDVLTQQIMPSTASSADMNSRRLGLETLHQSLQGSGHTLRVGWETILQVLGSIFRTVPSDPRSVSRPARVQSSRAARPGQPPPLGYLQANGLFCADGNCVPMYDAHLRWPRRALS